MSEGSFDQLNYSWISNFFSERIVRLPGHSWKVGVLAHGPWLIRDSIAAMLLDRQLRHRDDVAVVPVSAQRPEYEDCALGPKGNLLMLGRSTIFCHSRFSLYARWLVSKSAGSFRQGSGGRNGNAIVYGKRVFEQRRIDNDDPLLSLADVDYGMLRYRHGEIGGEVRTVCAIEGLSTFGTLAMTALLTNQSARQQLSREASRALAPMARHRARDAAELCVRFEVESESEMAKLPTRLLTATGSLPFSWRLECIAVATDNGSSEIAFAGTPGIELEYMRCEDRSLGGRVRRVGTDSWHRLFPMRAAVLEHLISWPKSSTYEALRAHCERVRGRLGAKTLERKRNSIPRLVQGLNTTLSKATGEAGTCYAHYDKSAKSYVLDGVWFRSRIDDIPAPSAAEVPKRLAEGR